MSGAQDEGAEKSHEPTPRKLEEARRKGDVPKSTDMGAAAGYLGLLAAITAFGAVSVQTTGSALAAFLDRADGLEGRILGPGGAGLSAALIGRAAAGLAPLLLIPFALVLASYVAQQAFVFAPDKLAPKLSRISIISNAKNKFGLTGLAEFAKTLVKLCAVSAVLGLFLSARLDEMIGLARAAPAAVPAALMRIGVGLLGAIAAVAVFIAAIDVVWQRFNHARKLRMSFQELKEEHKESEGDPHVKSERRRRAQDIATNRMMLEVPKADVVIVNPTHYAVALKWSRKPGSAPECVAKGVDEVALMIREKAVEAGVPIHSDPPTARALHATVEIGQEIAPEHYAPVAAAIRFAEAMRARARQQGWGGA
ncbi:flagellar type III secretion system protein FlhB [Oceanicella actignis]|uniref:Flagellar biosynthetic protein FlhB n=1 Tax=Oceanicella actignis TaxID=1189325 RepID=A0A1M7T491_9RHOB|nr:flagellar type III secretion system protein FlhB [Oceanicella actignis]SET41181.1 flagellar biosynthetic protein FlhB [Oceanicella actignis]SHN65516.1 flagellar biosynthetic protein FlhB [Oceanicella actignis]